MKERLTITLDNELLKKLDETIDGVNIRNRSHAIERLLDIVMAQAVPKKAVILAGGHTIRTRRHEDLPKPMVSVKGRPILEYVIKELKRNGVVDILIAIGKGGDKITSYFGDGSLFGVRLNYIKEDSPRGTESALGMARGLVGNSPFFVINGDNIIRIDLADMYKQHTSTKALATIALVTSEVTTNFGVTRLDGFKVSSFVEKPGDHQGSKLVSAGVYLFSTPIFELIQAGQTPTMLEKHLLPRLASAGNLYGYVFSSPWHPLDTKNLEESIRSLERIVDTTSEA